MSSDELVDDPLSIEHHFIQKLCECIQEESAADLDRLLYRNHNDWNHAIPKGMMSLATCDQTIRNKLERNPSESPVVTLRILQKWNCDLAEDKFQSIRTNVLYTLSTLNESNHSVLNASFDVIEFCLIHTGVNVQYFDCRALDEEEGLLAVSCAQSVDYAIYQSFQRINKMQDQKRQILSIFLLNVFRMDPYHGIIAEYCYSPYDFRFDLNDYHEATGQYKDRVNISEVAI